MRVVFLLLLAFSVSLRSFGQLVVSAPVLEVSAFNANGLQSSMNATLLALETEQKIFQEAMKKASWARNLQTTQRLLTLVESVVCTSKNINVRLAYFDRNCLYDLSLETSILKVSMAADFLAIIMTEGISLTTGERMDNIRNAVNAFQEAQKDLGSLNSALDKRLKKMQAGKQHLDNTKYLMFLTRK
jgi:hypothetical protein